MHELRELARVLRDKAEELDELRAEIDNVKKNLEYYLEKINDKKYTDSIYRRVEDGEISPLQALNEAKTTWETKQLADKTQQSDGQNNADITSNNSPPEYYRGSDGAYDGSYDNLQDSNTSDPYRNGSPQSSSKPENKNVNSVAPEVYQGSDWEWQLEQFNIDRSYDSHNNEQPDLRDNATPSPSTSSAQTGAPEAYQGSDWEWQLEQNNMDRSDDSHNNEHPDLRDNAPQSPSTSSAQTGAPEVYQGSDWEWQLEQNNMDRSDDSHNNEQPDLRDNATPSPSTSSAQTDEKPNMGQPDTTAVSANSGDNTTNYARRNNPPTLNNSSNDPHRNSGLAGNSDASGQGPAASKYRSIQTTTTDNDQAVTSDSNESSDRNNNADKRNSSVRRTRSAVSPRARRGANEFANSDGEVISRRKKRLQQEFTQDQHLGTKSRKKNLATQTDLDHSDTSAGYSLLNSDNQNVNSEYDTNYNTSDIEYSEYSPLNTDDQQETFNSASGKNVDRRTAQTDNTTLENRSAQTSPTAQSQIQSSDSGSEGFDDDVDNDSETWNSNDNNHAETLNSSQQKSHSPNKNNNFSNSAHGSAAPTVPRHSAHSAPVERNSDGIKYMERFDNNNFTSSDDSSATQKSNTDLEQTNHKSMSSQAKPDALDEQSQNYNLNSADNEHSSNQSETNQRLDQSYNSASNQATAASGPANPSNETQPDDFQNPNANSPSHPGSFDSSISQSSSASSDVPTKAPKIHPLDVICDTLDKRTKNKEEVITAEALFKKYKMGGKFVRNMLRAFPLPELVQKNPEVKEAVDDLVNYLSDHRNKLTKDQKYLKAFFAKRGYGSKD